MDTKTLGKRYDVLAPDRSEIRLLSQTGRGSMVHCTLNPGEVSLAVAHKTVEELWYFLEGTGEVWRKRCEDKGVVEVEPGVSLSIPTGAHFQFRNTGKCRLRFVIVTMPPWPSEHEAYRVPDHWPTNGNGT